MTSEDVPTLQGSYTCVCVCVCACVFVRVCSSYLSFSSCSESYEAFFSLSYMLSLSSSFNLSTRSTYTDVCVCVCVCVWSSNRLYGPYLMDWNCLMIYTAFLLFASYLPPGSFSLTHSCPLIVYSFSSPLFSPLFSILTLSSYLSFSSCSESYEAIFSLSYILSLSSSFNLSTRSTSRLLIQICVCVCVCVWAAGKIHEVRTCL